MKSQYWEIYGRRLQLIWLSRDLFTRDNGDIKETNLIPSTSERQRVNETPSKSSSGNRMTQNGVSLLFGADDTAAAKELPEGDLRLNARVLAEERRRPAGVPRDPPVPAAQEPQLQARRVQRYLIQRTGRLEPDPAFYDRRAQRQLVELPIIDQARSSQTKLVPR